jgi:hypothetical protein
MRASFALCRRGAGASCLALAVLSPTGTSLASDAPAAVAVSLPASMPLRRDPDLPGVPAGWASSLALLALGGAGGACWWWRRKGRADGDHRTRVRAAQVVRLASQSLTQQASVHAIEWQGEELLVACTGQQVTVLSRRSSPQAEHSS